MVRVRHVIDLHKGLTLPVVLCLMWWFDCWTTASWVYLAMHGGYGISWVLKSNVYPDKAWENEISPIFAVYMFTLLMLYWAVPFVIARNHVETPGPLLSVVLLMYILGLVAHHGSDAQKYYTLKLRPGLITNGFFARTRNPNYLGELMIYVAFAAVGMHWIGFAVVALFFCLVFVPQMRRKDKSLQRYDEFAAYKERTSILFPKLW